MAPKISYTQYPADAIIQPFEFPIPASMENDRVRLVPFELENHAETVYNEMRVNENDIYNYMPIGPYDSLEAFKQFFGPQFIGDRTRALFIVQDKTKGNAMAGIIGYLFASATDLCLELGPVVTFPGFRGSHVTPSSIGLMLHYALDLPAEGGLGLRRVVWCASNANVGSVRVAERAGFQKEGILRWARTIAPPKTGANGQGLRNGDPKPDHMGRDTVMLSLCWDDWESGGRETTNKTMER